MPNVLLIAYHYPPEGGSSGVLRTLKFSKYLPRHGWKPHILTLRESLYPAKDEGLLGDVPPQAVVHRTYALDSARHLAIQGRHLALLTVPDRFISWLPFGVARGLRVIRQSGIRLLYSTSPPPTTHLIAVVLKALTGLPWVADFRDPWVEEGFYPLPGTLRYHIETTLEQYVIRRADRLTVTTPYLQREFIARYPQLTPETVQVIYNGYDETDFQQVQSPVRSAQFEILHAGLVTPEFRDPRPLLQAVTSLIADGSLPRREVRITFLGGDAYVHSQAFAALVTQLDLEDVVSVCGRVSHQAALQRQGQAAVLLLLQASDDTRSLIPAKAFEYLRIGRPILVLTLAGATADLMQGMGSCYVVSPADQDGLRRAVLMLYTLWQQSPHGAQVSRPIQHYERSHLTVKLAHLFGQLAAQDPT
jgi:glycosyltransferase involved in cell wall biosynthesis